MSREKPQLPHSEVIERLVLAGFVADPLLVGTARDMLDAKDFDFALRSELFTIATGLPSLDRVLLREALKAHPSEAKRSSLLAELDACFAAQGFFGLEFRFEAYCVELRERSVSRALISFAKTLAQTGPEGLLNGSAWNDAADAEIQRIVSRRVKVATGPQEFEKVLEEVSAMSEAPAASGVGKTGLVDLDLKIGQLQRGGLYVLAGRPSMGKSALALQVCLEVAAQGQRTLVFSYEMNRHELSYRALGMVTGIETDRILRKRLSDAEKSLVQQANMALRAINLKVVSWATTSIEEVQRTARAEARANGGQLGVILVDYLQLMSTGKRHSNNEQALSQISHELKALAVELNCAVIAVSALNRDCEKREDMRPRLSDMRECGAIEYDANVLIAIHRQEFYTREKAMPEDIGVAEAIVLKQRGGEPGTVRLRFHGPCTRFSDMRVERHLRSV